jgi:hypothetical protein
VSRSTPIRDAEAARWERIQGTLDPGRMRERDPLRGHRACALCKDRGPLVPAWMHLDKRIVFGHFTKDQGTRAAALYICADRCAPPETILAELAVPVTAEIRAILTPEPAR